MSTEEQAEVVPEQTGWVAPEDRITVPRLTKYERTKVVGVRKEQIARGAPIMVPVEEGDDLDSVVERELREGVLPLMIKRPLPNGTFELWRLAELLK